MFLENKATQIRKMLLGSLLLAKDAWKDTLFGTPERLRVLKTVEDAKRNSSTRCRTVIYGCSSPFRSRRAHGLVSFGMMPHCPGGLRSGVHTPDQAHPRHCQIDC